jgi:glutathionyl-hydroquinone reductase
MLASVVGQANDCSPTGWRFVTPEESLPGENTVPDPLHPDFTHLRQIYFKVDPEYKGRFTVPTLFDKKTGQIVSNEVWFHGNSPVNNTY